MKVFLEGVLPKILPDDFKYNENYFLRAHEGKSDLQKSIPTKVRAFAKMGLPVAIVILQDKDSSDCKVLKKKLLDLCDIYSNDLPILIRIVCNELESWYLGDMEALEQAYPRFKAKKYKNRAKYRIPDTIQNTAQELKSIIPDFQKVKGAKLVSEFINIGKNRSESFRQFVLGLNKLLNDLGT
jgi:hypothetical protein